MAANGRHVWPRPTTYLKKGYDNYNRFIEKNKGEE